MSHPTRRVFVSTLSKVAGAAALFPASIQRALAVPANRRTGTIQDVEHVVILTQENRSFDHYFGSMPGVRGFADPFPIPVPDRPGIVGRTVWNQRNVSLFPLPPAISSFHLNTTQHFEYMRVEGTNHGWQDAQAAWNHGRLDRWTYAKKNHSLGYFKEEDIPFQWALANAFTLCDAYHCSSQTGTNTNRLFLFTGTNDPQAEGNGPAIYNDYDWFDADPGNHGGYRWITYAERLEQAGVSWRVYEDMADNFTDNPLAGFQSFRDAWFQRAGYSEALRDKGCSTRALDGLAADVLAGTLPQVSWVVAPAEASEHPGPSSPAQGADYIARVLDALTANPEVWSRTVFIINFDENDGFFDHVPPPAPPSCLSWDDDPARRVLAGGSTVDTTGEYHEHVLPYHDTQKERDLLHRPYGLGPRVPLYVVSPWSKGGWVNSQVFDHTSVLRFLERRFGVAEPNVSAWRRAVCGDLTSAFDFASPDAAGVMLPSTTERAEQARALPRHTTPPNPTTLALPEQRSGIRPSRALPYELHVAGRVTGAPFELSFANTGRAAAVFHVYDRKNLEAIPRRYTVEPGKTAFGSWVSDVAGSYDLWVLGPNGFHRHFTGDVDDSPVEARLVYDKAHLKLEFLLEGLGRESARVRIAANRYADRSPTETAVSPGALVRVSIPLTDGPWYDFTVSLPDQPGFARRFAGRVETGADSFSDPAMSGLAVGNR